MIEGLSSCAGAGAAHPVLTLPLLLFLTGCLYNSFNPRSTLDLILLAHLRCLPAFLCACCVKIRARFSALQLHCVSICQSAVVPIGAV